MTDNRVYLSKVFKRWIFFLMGFRSILTISIKNEYLEVVVYRKLKKRIWTNLQWLFMAQKNGYKNS